MPGYTDQVATSRARPFRAFSGTGSNGLIDSCIELVWVVPRWIPREKDTSIDPNFWNFLKAARSSDLSVSPTALLVICFHSGSSRSFSTCFKVGKCICMVSVVASCAISEACELGTMSNQLVRLILGCCEMV